MLDSCSCWLLMLQLVSKKRRRQNSYCYISAVIPAQLELFQALTWSPRVQPLFFRISRIFIVNGTLNTALRWGRFNVFVARFVRSVIRNSKNARAWFDIFLFLPQKLLVIPSSWLTFERIKIKSLYKNKVELGHVMNYCF